MWIEGEGTVRTMFRKMSLWDYASKEKSKLQLLRAIEKGNTLPSLFLVQFAIDRRKNEIQWISLYFPLLMLVSPLFFFMYGALISHIAMYLYLGMGLMVSLSVVFRITFYNQYLDACKFLYHAGDCIFQEVQMTTPGRMEASEWEEVQTIKQTNFTAAPAITEYVQVHKETLPLVEGAETPLPESVLEKIDPIVMPEEDNEMETEEGDPKKSRKGVIPLVLLHELVKKECGQPNIFKGDQHENAELIALITDFKAPNIAKKMGIYKNRELINRNSRHIRTTHKGYLETLLHYYSRTENDTLYRGAENLQSFLERSPAEKK